MAITNFKLWLVKKDITQAVIARETGLHPNTVSKIARTGNANKSVKHLIAMYLELDYDEFNKLLEKAY